MADKTTISVREATLERFNQAKSGLDAVQDAPDHSADSFLNALLDTWEKVGEEGYGSADVNATAEITPVLDEDAMDELITELKNQMSMLTDPGVVVEDGDVERFMRQLDAIEERTGRIERQLEDLQR